jgi:Arc/MetJ family transcription regulator
VADEWTSEIDASFARAICDRLDAIAALGAERHAPEAPWTAAAAVEQRLIEAVERLLKLEGSAARIAEEARRVASGGGDAKRAWSVALLLGSAPTFDAVEAAVSTLRCPHADLRAAAVEALGLSRNAAVGPAVARLLEDAAPAACAAALEVLRFRRQAPYAPCVVLLGHPDARVAAAAARCLGTVAERKAAAAVLRRVLGDDPDEVLALAAAESLLALGDPAGLAYVRGELEAESASPSLSDDVRVAFVRLLALAGDASDLELFFRSVEPSPRDAVAVGWFGHPDLVDWLIGSLETANEARRAGARGRGAPGQAAPSSFELAATQALARIAGTPEGAPAPGTEAAAWRSWWARTRARLTPGLKHRFGRPYTPEATLEELAGDASAATRAHAALELAIVAGSASIETGDWVTRQKAAIAAAGERLAGFGGWTAGGFPGRKLGR